MLSSFNPLVVSSILPRPTNNHIKGLEANSILILTPYFLDFRPFAHHLSIIFSFKLLFRAVPISSTTKPGQPDLDIYPQGDRLMGFLCGITLVFGLAGNGTAALWDRGSGLIYCDTLDIAFMQHRPLSGYSWDVAIARMDTFYWGSWRLPDAHNLD